MKINHLIIQSTNQLIIKFVIGLLVFIGIYLLIGGSQAVAQQLLRYPVKELGYCRDAKECYLYCEIPENKPACWSYGKYVLGLGKQVLGKHSDREREAAALGITFPIAELGGCASVNECRAYCENPQNQEACMSFARQKGIGQYKQQNDMLERAKQELGCTSMQSCQAYCNDPGNADRCMEFASRHAPPEVREQMGKTREMMQRAKQTLGCDSFANCQAVCQNPQNAERCARFAEEHAPPEVRQKIQEFKQRVSEQAREHGLPCDSFEACRAYCQSNPGECQEFQGPGGQTTIQIHKEESFSCNTEEECRRLCEQNPDRCPGFKDSPDYQRFQNEQEKVRFQTEEEKRRFEQYQQEFSSPSGSF